MMHPKEDVRTLRKAIFANREKGEYSEELKKQVVSYAKSKRDEGVSFSALERELSLSHSTIKRWLKTSSSAREMRLLPVHIVPNNRLRQAPIQEGILRRQPEASPGSSLRLVLRHGPTLEGLSFAQACELLKMWDR
jgi:hypothetical protein